MVKLKVLGGINLTLIVMLLILLVNYFSIKDLKNYYEREYKDLRFLNRYGQEKRFYELIVENNMRKVKCYKIDYKTAYKLFQEKCDVYPNDDNIDLKFFNYETNREYNIDKSKYEYMRIDKITEPLL